MGECNLNIGSLQMYDGIETLGTHALHEKVLKTVARYDTLAIVHDGKTGVQVGVVAQHGLDDSWAELVAYEQVVIGLKDHLCSVLFGTGQSLIGLEFAALELEGTDLTVTPAAHLEDVAERINCLKADTVQTNALLERLAVKLTAGIKHADRLDKFALRDTATVVTDYDTARIGQIDLNAFAGIHTELIDAVVNDLLEQYVYSVIGGRSVAEFTDVHTWTGTDMLHIVHVADIVLVILHLWCLRVK